MLSKIYRENYVDNGAAQFYATMMVLQFAERYRTLYLHRERIVFICNGRK